MDINLLSDEIKEAFEEQKAMFQEMLKAYQETNAILKESLKQKDNLIEDLQQQLATLRKVIFGSRSEKTVYIDPAQKPLFFEFSENNTQLESSTEQPEIAKTVHVPTHDRKAKRSRDEIYANLPPEREIIELPYEQCFDSNGRPLTKIGLEYLRTEIRSTPASHKRIEIYVQKYKASNEDTEDVQIVRPDVPVPLIEHSYASASTVALIIANKYFAGLPLYRQEQVFKQQGFPLTRTIMANWVITVSKLYFEKIYLRLCKLIVEQKVIHADETPIQVLKEPGKKPQQKSYMWVYSTSKRADIQIRCFSYENTRSGERAHKFLKDFTGILISDGYNGYLKVETTRAGCWAHMRRKWVEAMPTGVPSESSTAAIGLDYCTRLFEFERRIEHLTDEQRTVERQKIHVKDETCSDDRKDPASAKEILQEYWTWIDTIGATTGKVKKAVTYALNQKPYLETFLEHGEIEISNNQVENAIRPFVVGRKGWLFSDTVEGAHASAVIYSLIETAKANNIKPGEWLEHILSVLPERFAYDPNDCIDDLLPWADEMQSKFKLKN